MFAFDTHSAQQIMVPRSEMEVLDLQNSWEDNLQIILDNKHSRFPVFDGNSDTPVGVLLVKDLYNAMLGNEASADPIQALRANLRETVVST